MTMACAYYATVVPFINIYAFATEEAVCDLSLGSINSVDVVIKHSQMTCLKLGQKDFIF